MKQFKHSGATGDLIYSMALVKHFGGGNFYLHLNQIDWIGQHYYRTKPNPYHQGRMTQKDFDYMQEFMSVQSYINSFNIMETKTEITHNLDRFRPLFVGHPGNYVDIYSSAFGINDTETRYMIRNTPWLSVPNPVKVPNKPVIINRTLRWIPSTPGQQWAQWKNSGLDQQSVFVGHEDEYMAFKQYIGWDIPYIETHTQLELASVIAGADLFIGNQSQCLALAIGLGKNYACEARSDLPLARNECYFDRDNGTYF